MNILKEKRLQRLTNLYNIPSNWDNKSACKMSEKTLSFAKHLIENDKTNSKYGIFLNEDGSVLFDYFDLEDDQEFSIEIKDERYTLIKNENENVFFNKDEFLFNLSNLLKK